MHDGYFTFNIVFFGFWYVLVIMSTIIDQIRRASEPPQ